MGRREIIKNKENLDKSKIALIIFRVLSIIIIIICLIVLYNWHLNNKKNISIMDELEEYAQITETNTSENDGSEDNAEEKLAVNFEELKAKNADTVGWVKVNNTNIDFPVVQSSDNNYYLKHNFKKESNGAGWIFADYRCNFDDLDKNTIIYGHNRRNGTMFSNLTHTLDSNWNFENENSYFYFSTSSASYKAEIFSVYMMKATKLTISNEFADNSEFTNYINSLKELSIHDFNVNISEEDNIITLCTCDNTNQKRIVIHAKLIKQ